MNRLAEAVNDYLLWLIKNNYAENTITLYEYVLKHFQAFIGQTRICWEDLFTYETLQNFDKHTNLPHTPVKGLARYLHSQNKIRAPIKKPVIPLPDIYQDYLLFCENIKRVDQSYISATKKLLSALHHYLKTSGIALEKLFIEHMDKFLLTYNAPFKPATRRHHRTYLRGFLTYLYQKGIIKRNLASFIVGPPDFAYTNPPKFLTPDKVEKLFSSLTAESPKDLRTAAMVHLGYTLGLRPKEISRIQLDYVFFAKEQIRIPDRKSTQPITLPLPEITIKAVAAYIVGGRPKTDHRALFLTLTAPFKPVTAVTVSRDVTNALQKISPRSSAYWLRHTYAQNLFESNASLFEVKQMMGHGNVQATRRYLHIHIKMMRKVLFDETL